MSERPSGRGAAAEISAPVARVTVYEDRAEVVREATLMLPGGQATFWLRGLSPLIGDQHLLARLEAVGDAQALPGARLDDVRIHRRWLGEGGSERPDEALHDELREAEDQVHVAEAGHRLAVERREALKTMLSRYCAQLGRAVWGSAPGQASDWEADLDRLQGAYQHAEEGVASARCAVRSACARLERVQDLVDARRGRPARPVVDLELCVSGTRGPAHLIVSTVLPCALWRPTHEAHLAGDRLVWTTYANVWQRTGEPWENVALTLSTARPSAGAALPALAEDRLRLRLKSPVERQTVFVEHRQETIARPPPSGAAPGVYDGGEARRFAPACPMSVPSDGRPHRVAVDTFETTARVDRIAYPDLCEQVFNRASLTNTGQQPILAGPVTLVRDGAYVGTGDVLYVGPGEGFELAFGSDDRFQVRTRRRRLEQERMMRTGRVHYVLEVDLGHTCEGAIPLEVLLRLPVSELEQLRVVPTLEHCSEGRPKLDADGLLRLSVVLEPGVERQLRVGFHFEKSGDVRMPHPW